jgi:hypothetical protein
MKTLKTIALASSLLATSLLATNVAHAAKVETAGQAMTLCKAKAETAHTGYKRSKSTKIKQTRGVFKITLKVITDSESVKTKCKVDKDGTVTYSQA